MGSKLSASSCLLGCEICKLQACSWWYNPCNNGVAIGMFTTSSEGPKERCTYCTDQNLKRPQRQKRMSFSVFAFCPIYLPLAPLSSLALISHQSAASPPLPARSSPCLGAHPSFLLALNNGQGNAALLMHINSTGVARAPAAKILCEGTLPYFTGLFKRIWSKVAVKHWIVIA